MNFKQKETELKIKFELISDNLKSWWRKQRHENLTWYLFSWIPFHSNFKHQKEETRRCKSKQDIFLSILRRCKNIQISIQKRPWLIIFSYWYYHISDSDQANLRNCQWGQKEIKDITKEVNLEEHKMISSLRPKAIFTNGQWYKSQ